MGHRESRNGSQRHEEWVTERRGMGHRETRNGSQRNEEWGHREARNESELREGSHKDAKGEKQRYVSHTDALEE